MRGLAARAADEGLQAPAGEGWQKGVGMAERTLCAHVAHADSASASRGLVTLSAEKMIGGGRSYRGFCPDGVATLSSSQQFDSAAAAQSWRAVGASAVFCAVQVRLGSEDAMARRILRVAEPLARDAFALRRELLRREDGAWHTRQDVLFPGYVIVETSDPSELVRRMGVLTELSYVLRGAGGGIAVLEKHEAELVHALGGSSRTVGVSKGEIVAGYLHVFSGPLTGLEHLVSKIDRHKRIAYLDAAAFGHLSAEPRYAGVRRGSSGQGARRRMPRVALEVVRKV